MLKNLLSNNDVNQIESWLKHCRSFVICAHVSPDGDAVGACIGLSQFLKQKGKEVHVILPNAFPDFLSWIEGCKDIVLYDKQTPLANQLIASAEVICCLDFNSLSRLEEMGQSIQQSSAALWLIDHHLMPDSIFQVAISHPEMSSTSELVFRCIYQLGGFGSMTKGAAEALYCGMCTDTGGFTYNSNNSEIYQIISCLLEKGIDKDLIYRRIYNNYSSSRIHLMGYVLYEKLHVYENFHASLFTLTREEQKKFQFIKGDAEGFVNIPLTIKNMRLSVSLREDTEKNRVLVSLRSVDDFPCNKMAEDFFNGGGHLNAAGGRLDCSMNEAIEIFKQAIIKYEPLLVIKK